MEPLLTNPPPTALGLVNAILTGKSCHYEVSEFPGPLSVKSVLRGSAVWQTGRTPHRIEPGTALVLNHGEPYSMRIDSPTLVETFCVFFRRGFVEDAARVARESAETLLDDPFLSKPIQFGPDGAVAHLLSRCRTDAESGVIALAEALAGLRTLRCAKAATRDELLKRVLRGRDYIEDHLGAVLRLTGTAQAACMSPFHFHRAFRSVFGEAPHDYVKRRRLEIAVDLLRRSEEPVTTIALRCGFETPSAFATAFRKRFGCPPVQFRKNGKVGRSQIAGV